MAARAIWKGSFDLRRTDLLVQLYSAVEDRTVHFHLLEKRTHARVKQHMVNPSTSKQVRSDEIRKGYEIEPDTFVIVGDHDLKKIEPEPSSMIELTSFLPEDSIGHQYYDRRTIWVRMAIRKRASLSQKHSRVKEREGSSVIGQYVSSRDNDGVPFALRCDCAVCAICPSTGVVRRSATTHIPAEPSVRARTTPPTATLMYPRFNVAVVLVNANGCDAVLHRLS
jgi:hypothetical protein